jgi:hypothetical protein
MDRLRSAGLASPRAAGRDASHATSLGSIGPALRSLRDHAIILRLLLGAEDATRNCSSQNELGGLAQSPAGRSTEFV